MGIEAKKLKYNKGKKDKIQNPAAQVQLPPAVQAANLTAPAQAAPAVQIPVQAAAQDPVQDLQ